MFFARPQTRVSRDRVLHGSKRGKSWADTVHPCGPWWISVQESCEHQPLSVLGNTELCRIYYLKLFLIVQVS